MNEWTIACIIIAVIFGIMGVIFALLKEKGAILISGFNTIPKEERDKYDKKKMSIDMRNDLFTWTGILLLGAILSYFISDYYALIAFIIWIILFLKGVHIDIEKAFSKYRKQV
jgi:hypothetical protein